MTPLERELELAAQACAQRILDGKRSKRGERLVPVEQSAHAALEVLRCTRCACALWPLESRRNAQNEVRCTVCLAAPQSGLTNRRAICTKCHDSVASGVWRYGGVVNFGRGAIAWERTAALCAACGFNAVNWTTLARPELAKRQSKAMTGESIRRWYAKNPPKAVRYVQWCRLVQDGRAAAHAFTESVQEKVEAALAPSKYEQFDMSDPEAAWRFLKSVGLGQR